MPVDCERQQQRRFDERRLLLERPTDISDHEDRQRDIVSLAVQWNVALPRPEPDQQHSDIHEVRLYAPRTNYRRFVHRERERLFFGL